MFLIIIFMVVGLMLYIYSVTFEFVSIGFIKKYNDFVTSPKTPIHFINDQWYILNKNIFLKPSSAMYFLDKNRILIFLQCTDSTYANNMDHLKFTFNINIFSDEFKVPVILKEIYYLFPKDFDILAL